MGSLTIMSEQSVKRRHVFYIPGYDPFHPRRYRELYRREAAEQARISGYEISISPKSGEGPYGWHVVSTQDGQTTQTEIEVLVWHDIVKNSMAQGIWATYVQLVQTAWLYLGSGALFRLMRLRKGPMIAALYPVFFLLLQLGIAMAVGLGAFAGLSTLVPESMFSNIVFVAVGIGLMWGVLDLFRRYDSKFFAYYLMHDYAFSAQFSGENPPQLLARIDDFTEIVERKLTEDYDEILIIGHSSGAHLAISILANLYRRSSIQKSGSVLSFLTLGQVVPMVSFLPKANRLRADLHLMGKQDSVSWIDITAPGDGCAFALCDPVAVTGVATEYSHQPLILSAAFTKTLSSEKWKALRWRFFQLHFQYLCAFDRPGDYDYFRITAGPNTLDERFAHRTASPNRICKAVNRYRDMGP